jgi:hypothetical protein
MKCTQRAPLTGAKLLLLIILATILAACASQIGLKQDVNLDTFAFGKSTKLDVVNAFGLPQKIVRDDAGEHYFYEKSARLISMCLGCGQLANPTGAVTDSARSAQSSGSDRFEFVFDAKGVLIDGH